MSVVIRPEDGQPDSMKVLLAAVQKIAGDEPVTVGSGGVVVSRAVAKKFLNARTTSDPDTTAATTTAPTGDGADAAGQAADGGDSSPDASGGAADEEPTPAPAPARKSTPAKKTTAAAQQRATRSNTRSKP